MGKTVAFNEQQLNDFFPFYLMVNKEMKISSVSNGLDKLCHLRADDSLTDHFKIIEREHTGFSLDLLSDCVGFCIELVSLDDRMIILSGKFHYLPDIEEYLFICSPSVETSRYYKRESAHVFLGASLPPENSEDLDKIAKIARENVNGILLTDNEGCIEWVNQAFEHTTGYSMQEVIGKRPRQVLYGKLSVYVPEYFVDQNVKSKKPFTFENIGYTKENTTFWFRAVVHPLINDLGELTGRFSVLEDITEIKKKQAEINLSRDLWDLAIESGGHAAWSRNIEKGTMFFSAQFKKLLRYGDIDEFKSKDWYSAMHPADWANFVTNIKPLLGPDNPVFVHEHRLMCKDGIYRYFVTHGKITEWNGGKGVLSVGTISDINELKYTTELLKTLTSNLNYGILYTDANTENKILYVNQAFCDMFGAQLSPADFIGENGKRKLTQFARVFTGEINSRTDEIIRMKVPVLDEQWILEDGRIIRRDFIPVSENGQTIGHLWQHRDVSEKMKLQSKLQKLSERFYTLINCLETGILFEGSDGTILYCNRYFTKMLNPALQPEDLIGKKTANTREQLKELFLDFEKFGNRIIELKANNVKLLDEPLEMVDGKIFLRDFIPIGIDSLSEGFLWQFKEQTERIKLTAELQITNKRLSTLVTNLNGGVLVEDQNRKVVLVNKAFCDLFGIVMTPEELIGLDLSGIAAQYQNYFSNPDLPLRLSEGINSVQELVQNNEMVVDEVIHMESGLILSRDFIPIYVNGQFTGRVWKVRDVSEQIKAETKLREQKEFYENILNEIPADIAIIGPDGNSQFVNKHAEETEELKEWLQAGNNELNIRRDNAIALLNIARNDVFYEALSSKNPVKLVEENTNVNGKTRYILRVFYPSLNIDGNVGQVITYGTDITEQKEKEIFAEVQEQRIRNLMEIINDGVFRFFHDGSITLYNDSFLKIMDIEHNPYDTVPLNFFDMLPIDELVRIRQKISLLKATGNPQFGMFRLNGGKENEKIVDYTMTSAIRESDAAVVFRITDVTAIINREKNLNEIIEKEKNLNISKSRFIRITSHELRTPLAIIQANADILEMIGEAGTDVPESFDTSKITSRIEREVIHMTAILDQLLMISRIEAGNVELNAINNNMYRFLDELKGNYFYPYMDGRFLDIKCSLDTVIFPFDKELMKLAIINLVSNAFKYSMGKREPVLIAREDLDHIYLEVQDFGIGIPKDEEQHLFESFYRASNVGVIQGTGLGLMIVDYVVKKHGGKLSFRSILNEGTTFIISVPKKQKDAETKNTSN